MSSRHPDPTSPPTPAAQVYLTMAEAAERLRFKSGKGAALRFCRRHSLPLCWRGNTALIRVDVLDRFLETGETGMRDRIRLVQATGRRKAASR